MVNEVKNEKKNDIFIGKLKWIFQFTSFNEKGLHNGTL